MSRTVDNAKQAIAASKKQSQQSEQGQHVFVLIDESGSMSGLEEAVVSGCNEFLNEFKDEHDTRIWLAWFDESPGEPRMRLKVTGEQAQKVAALTASDYSPRGMTPLNDAVADAVDALDKAVQEGEGVFLAIITDGMENASERSDESLKDLLAKREEQGWSVVYIGANQDSVRSASRIGLAKKGVAFDFAADAEGVHASMRTVSHFAKRRKRYGYDATGRERFDAELADEHDKRGGRADDES